MEFLFASENMPFSVAIAVMLGIAFLEGVLTLLGAGLSNLVDAIIPDSLDMDLDLDVDADIDADVDFDTELSLHDNLDIGKTAEVASASENALSKMLAWLHFGRVPALVLLVIMLTVFGLSGYVLQAFVHGFTGWLLPGWAAWLPALAIALPFVRWSAKILGTIIPKDETSAVSTNTFIGRVATIVTGTSQTGLPAEAKLKDQHGQSHYVMVEPDLKSDEFPAGSRVLLVSQAGHIFKGIAPQNEALVNDGNWYGQR